MLMQDAPESAQPTRVNSKLLTLLLLAIILSVQVCVSIPRLNLPFLDTRLHWYFDNAMFLLMAVHSSDETIDDPRKIFGVANYEYNHALQPAKIHFYSNHGVLSPTLFLQFSKLVGFKEYTPRIFSLLVSLCASLLLFLTIKKVLNSNMVAFILTALYVSMPLQSLYMDQMKYSNMEALIFFAFLFSVSHLEARPLLRIARITLALSAFLLFHTDYPIFFPAIAAAIYLLARKTGSSRILVFSMMAGIVSTLLIQWWLGFGPVNAASKRIGFDQAGLTTGSWLQKQWLFLAENFGEVQLFFMGLCLVQIAIKPALLKNFWVYSGFVTFLGTLLYLTVFRNQSSIHHFNQWHLATGYVLMLIGLAQIYSWAEILERKKRYLFLLPFLFLNFYQSYDLYKKCRAPEFAKPQDIQQIRAIDKRILYFTDGTSGPHDWWNGPGIKLYKDPIFNGKKTPSPIPTGENVTYEIDEDLLAVLNDPKAIQYVYETMKHWYPDFILEPVEQTPTFVFFRLRKQ
jgi:hypothetical protein